MFSRDDDLLAHVQEHHGERIPDGEEAKDQFKQKLLIEAQVQR